MFNRKVLSILIWNEGRCNNNSDVVTKRFETRNFLFTNWLFCYDCYAVYVTVLDVKVYKVEQIHLLSDHISCFPNINIK